MYTHTTIRSPGRYIGDDSPLRRVAMQFGMFTEFHIRHGGTESEAFDHAFELVDAAEQLGLDAVWLAEHHFSPERSVLASPIVIASAIAARTRRLRIGLAVQVLPLTNP